MLAVELARAAADAGVPLPLLVYLGNWTGDESLAQFITAQAPEVGWALEGLSHAGRLVLLLDGLNEVPTPKRGTKAAEVLQALEKSDSDTKVIVSCRLKDYTSELDLGCDTLTLEPLSPPRVLAVLRHWLDSDEDGEAVRTGSSGSSL
jgi:hypothetical protein